jgi:hypothetical protein
MGRGWDMKSNTTVSKMSAVGKSVLVQSKKWARNEKCTSTLENEPAGGECTTTVFKMGAVGKVYEYSAKKWLLNGKFTSTVSKMGAMRKRLPEPLYDAM